MTWADAKAEASVVAGMISLQGLDVYDLFDLGATHSFVSKQFASKLGVELDKLECDFFVVTLLGVSMCASYALKSCEVCLARRNFMLT